MLPETQFVLNTFAFLIWGALVMWMAAGFTMLESGSVRTKNASVICLKNLGLYAIAGLAYYVIGYNLMYTDVSGFIGSFKLFFNATPAEIALVDGDASVQEGVVDSGYSQMSGWFFQMVFVATAASIVSGALAERIRLWAFFTFVIVLTAIIYPIVGAWTWGEGWLYELGFSDFAGSTIVHGTGGWAALAGAIILGPRLGKFKKDGSVNPTPPSSVPIVTLGVFILWFGWFGFNGGSQLALGGAVDAISIAGILVNTNLAGAAGAFAAIVVSRTILGRFDMFAILNGALAGLVSITAAPTMHHHGIAILIGFVGGVVCVLSIKLLDVLKIDDVVGAVPVHLFAGIWGTIAVAFTVDGTSFGVQLLGIIVIGAFVFATSFAVWKLIDILIGARVAKSVERLGQDTAELGVDAYPEFVLMPEDYDDEDE